MLSIRNLILIVAVSVMSLNVYAQRFSFEANAGLGVASMSNIDSRMGFHIGIIGNYQFPKSAGPYINGGLLFKLKGAQSTIKGSRYSFGQYCFEIPVHVGYKYEFNNNVALFGEFGPYIGIGLFGGCKIKDSGSTIVDVDTYGDIGGIKRFDFGFGFKLGVELNKRIPISVGYDFGVLNVNRDEGMAVRNNYLGFSVGYRF